MVPSLCSGCISELLDYVFICYSTLRDDTCSSYHELFTIGSDPVETQPTFWVWTWEQTLTH